MASKTIITGKAAEVLEIYRQREKELKKEGRKKPDMIANSELGPKFTNKKHARVKRINDRELVRQLGEDLKELSPQDDSREAVERAKDILQRLSECRVTNWILRNIGDLPRVLKKKWSKHPVPELGALAKKIQKEWIAIYEAEDDPNDLRGKYEILSHGIPEGIPTGAVLNNKGEAAILGIHTLITRGIDCIKDEPCYAVSVSGGYEDDKDNTRKDGTIIYTGEGGRDPKTGLQVKDQKENPANASLLMSIDKQVPVRVLRKRKKDGTEYYTYDGLYMVVGHTYDRSKEGPKIYLFTLKPLEALEADAFAVGFEGARRGSASQAHGRVRSRLDDAMQRKNRRSRR